MRTGEKKRHFQKNTTWLEIVITISTAICIKNEKLWLIIIFMQLFTLIVIIIILTSETFWRK